MAFFLRVLKSRKWLLLPPIVLGVVGVVVFAQFRKELPRSEPAEQSKSLPVIRVRRQAVVPVVSGYGTATAARRWNAVSEVQGRIVEIHPQLESGNTVAANELLIRIDDTDTQLLLVQRQADLASARAQLQELQAEYESDLRLLPFARKQLELASREEQRALELQRRNATSLSEVDQLTSGRLVQEQTLHNLQTAISLYPSQMGAAQAAIALAQAQVREAERDIERTRIVAPFDGMLSGVDLEVGQFIGVNQSLFELFDDQRIEVTAQYSLEQLGKLLPSLSRGGVDDSVQASETDTLPFTARVVVRSGDYKREWIGRRSGFLNRSTSNRERWVSLSKC
ncbi:hypothetical protein C2E31_19120 [Rhodopirellula baltica]|nr:hypothetical protein C2E31_19120 [Rhodopirellula baltica]